MHRPTDTLLLQCQPRASFTSWNNRHPLCLGHSHRLCVRFVLAVVLGIAARYGYRYATRDTRTRLASDFGEEKLEECRMEAPPNALRAHPWVV